MIRLVRHTLPVTCLILVLGCGRNDTAREIPTTLETDRAERNALKTIPTVPAQGRWTEGHEPFEVAARTDHVRQYPCSACHEGPLDKMLTAKLVGTSTNLQATHRMMHVDINLNHATEEVMDCTTCHNADNLDTLKLNNGTAISVDHAYQMCAQCHFEQTRDWAGGAHGKRLGGWQGKRVVINCTECHDPHAPQWDKRWPLKHPRIPRKDGNHE